MALIEIDAVEVAFNGALDVRAGAIDRPRLGERIEVYHVPVEGWILGEAAPVEAVEFWAKGVRLRRVPLDQPRPDVAAVFPDHPWAGDSGFRTWLSVIGLPPEFEVTVDAILADKSKRSIATIRGRHRPVAAGEPTRLQPLMVSTIGRAGSTWLMRLLSEHPEIVIHRTHPYELRWARYWWHTLQVLTDPSNAYESAHPDSFQTRRGWTGHNPYHPEPLATTGASAEWFGRIHVEETAAFCRRSIDAGYMRIAIDQHQRNPRFFAEKGRADHIPWLVWELYPEAREIFLVRDFRDVVSSMLAFNARAGRNVFGPPNATEEEVVRFIREIPIEMLAQSWPRRRDRALLVRYENLVADPAAELSRILGYLELDDDAAIVSGMLERASRDNAAMRRHPTSRDAVASLGRWRTSLREPLQRLCTDLFRDLLPQFGYDD